MHFEKKDDILMELTKTAENKTENDAWLSLVERYVRDVEVAGSNPVTPTNEKESLKKGSFFVIEMKERSTDFPTLRSFVLCPSLLFLLRQRTEDRHPANKTDNLHQNDAHRHADAVNSHVPLGRSAACHKGLVILVQGRIAHAEASGQK